MNLFRSEEHARRWVEYNEAMASSLMPVVEWAAIFSNPIFRERGRSNYLTWLQSPEGVSAFADLRASLPSPATTS